MKRFYFFTIFVFTSLSITLQAQENLAGMINIINPVSTMMPGGGISASFDTAYCYITYDQLNNRSGPAKFALANPGNIILLSDQSGLNYLNGGTWGFDKKWFGAVSTDNTLITIDPVTGERFIIGKSGLPFSGISFDFTSNKLFGVSWDGLASSLYSINKTNGTASFIGQCCTDILINLACDASGSLYSVGILNDYLYKLNKSTGVAATIGSIGIDAIYQQDMEFDLNTGVLFMAAYNSTASPGELRTVDPATGASVLVGSFQGGAEITGLCIPNNAISVGLKEMPESDVFVKVFPNPGPGIFTVETDSRTYLFEVTNVLGKRIYSAKLNSDKAEIDLSKNQKGVYFYQAWNGSKILNSGKILIE